MLAKQQVSLIRRLAQAAARTRVFNHNAPAALRMMSVCGRNVGAGTTLHAPLQGSSKLQTRSSQSSSTSGAAVSFVPQRSVIFKSFAVSALHSIVLKLIPRSTLQLAHRPIKCLDHSLLLALERHPYRTQSQEANIRSGGAQLCQLSRLQMTEISEPESCAQAAPAYVSMHGMDVWWLRSAPILYDANCPACLLLPPLRPIFREFVCRPYSFSPVLLDNRSSCMMHMYIFCT